MEKIQSDGELLYLQKLSCPLCGKTSVRIKIGNVAGAGVTLVHPMGLSRPVPTEVPEQFAIDFREASLVIGISSKASAALSRRCLQRLLESHGKTTKRQLADQIQDVTDSGGLPRILREQLHVLREIGNFATHPIKSEHPGEIVDVDAQEATWCLETLEALFDFWFVKPIQDKAKLDAFNSRLGGLGRKAIEP